MAIAPYEQQWTPRRPPTPQRPIPRWFKLLAVLPVLAVVGWVVARDPGPGLHLSPRGWATLALVGVLVVALVRNHDRGRVGRDLLVAVVVLALVLPWPAAAHFPAPASQAAGKAQRQAAGLGDGCPGLKQARAWLECVSKQVKAAQDKKGGGS